MASGQQISTRARHLCVLHPLCDVQLDGEGFDEVISDSREALYRTAKDAVEAAMDKAQDV